MVVCLRLVSGFLSGIPRGLCQLFGTGDNNNNDAVFHLGIYACKVTDWNETKTKQVVVTVINPPHVEVTPLAVTVMEGQTTNCKCLSSDDDRGEFTYQWKKGGELLEASDKQTDEVIEDLYPTGSRLTVHAKKTTQVYTCAITAPSGEAQESCRINVAKGKPAS